MKEEITSLKHLLLIIVALSLVQSGCQLRKNKGPDYPISPVPFTDVKITDNFWSQRLLTNHKVTIPIAFQKAEETGRIDNFRIAGRLKPGKFSSLYPFDDSDVYKNIEAASYSLQLYPDPSLASYLDTLIGYIAAAQEPDGYLYTNRTIDPGNTHEMAGTERWVNEELSSHELYNAGHLYEAAVAHYQATGKRALLDVALKNANLIDSLFGWGKIEKAPGHQEIEIGLVKLYRVTGEKKYLDLAKFFLDVRGPGGDEYNQMHQKVYDQVIAVGHAVRAQYMYAAMADIAALTGETKYLRAIDTIWGDVANSKTYITGGIGAEGDIEGFGPAFYLPNKEAYCETCASIANALWNYRMFLLHGDSRYFDIFEKVLYNGLLSGVSLSGDHFFYPNPLASDGSYARKAWFGCACCPVNITRFLPSLPGYIYAIKNDSLYINLFIGNHANVVVNGTDIQLDLATGYPWDGDVEINLRPSRPVEFTLLIRVPGWARNEAFPTDLYSFKDKPGKAPDLFINGIETAIVMHKGYAVVKMEWKDGDAVRLDLPMEPRTVAANELVLEDNDRTALQRGPVIYCVESDPEMAHVLNCVVSDSVINYVYREDLLNGIGTLKGKDFPAIPYYSWANRGLSEMTVWLKNPM
jgi:DUF1680 family protein